MSIRTERLGAEIQRDLGPIFQKYQNNTIITVTKVRVTPDLSIAKVYISILAPNRDKNSVFAYLKEHDTEIRKELAQKIRHQVRKIPELHLYLDDTAEYVDRLENLFDKIHKEDPDIPDNEKNEGN
ncbi:MAG TPA: 30S ribosome-binding factor RbfA [Balneolales bacterium]|nr:30S ribosome-binding factor RbfA [Balneolales bacterium]